MAGPAEGICGDALDSLVRLVADGGTIEAAARLVALMPNSRDRLSPSPLRPIPEVGAVLPSLVLGAVHSLGLAAPHAEQPAPLQEAEPSTTPTAELEARDAHAMSTPKASLCCSLGDLPGPVADDGASPLPLSQLIMGGANPRGTAPRPASHLGEPPNDFVEVGVGINSMENVVALDCPVFCGAKPEPGQARRGPGPIFDYPPEPISPVPVVSPRTISSTERMFSSFCAFNPMSQDPFGPGPVFQMVNSLGKSG